MRKPGTKLFTINLTEEERAKLEAHRVALGSRAQTDVVRHWIDQPTVSAAMSVVGRAAQGTIVTPRAERPVGSYKITQPGAAAEIHSGSKLPVGPIKPDYGARAKGAKK